MSNLVFPDFPGLKPNVRRTPLTQTKVFTTISGTEQRVSWWNRPRYKYAVEYEFLRSASSKAEFQAMYRFMVVHLGAFDSFLFRDPEDCVAVDQPFGIGDGTTTVFQLQRALPGATTDATGVWGLYLRPRTNLLPYSQDFANHWTSYGVTFAVGFAAPDGSNTATTLTENAGTSNHGLYLSVASLLNPGSTFTASFYAQVLNPARNKVELVVSNATLYAQIVFDLTALTAVSTGSAAATGTVTDVGGGWRRIGITWTHWYDVSATYLQLRMTAASTDYYAGDVTASMLVWGAQLEVATAPTPYILTGVTAATDNPALWPALGDGFEPVYEPSRAMTAAELAALTALPSAFGAGAQALPAVRTNFWTYSEQFDNAVWTKNNVTVTANAATGPLGGATADSMAETVAAAAGHLIQQPVSFALPNVAYTKSVYAKVGPGPATRFLYIQARRLDGTWSYCGFNLSTGATVSPSNCLAQGAVSLGSGWYRCWITFNSMSGASTPSEGIFMSTDGTNAGTTYTGDGTSGVYLWGAQTEVGALSAYISTTATAGQAVDDYPDRFAMDWQGARAPYATARTNLLTWSLNFERWTANLVYFTPNASASPDGNNTACQVAKSNTTQNAAMIQNLSLIVGQQYTASLWLKAGSSSQVALGVIMGSWPAVSCSILSGPGSITSGGAGTLPILTGLSASTWTRVSLTFTAIGASGSFNVYPDTHVSTTTGAYVYAWGAQLEVGGAATAYVPTGSAAVTAPPEITGALNPYLTDSGLNCFGTKLAPFARTNYLLNSQNPAVWTLAGTATRTTGIADPLGGTTAATITAVASGSDGVFFSGIVPTSGAQCVGSVWVRRRTGSGSISILNPAFGAWFDIPVTSQWRRFYISGPSAVTTAYCGIRVNVAGDAVDVAFGQVELGTNPGAYIPTSGTTVAKTDYTLGANGSVTLGAAPVSGACLNWTGGYWRRVRFNADEGEAEQFASQFWKTKALEMISV